MLELEATSTSLQINNTSLSDIVESQDALVGELNNRVDVFEEERFMLREELKLAAIGLYVDQLEEGLDSFVVTRRDIYVREERCTNSKLETARLGEKIDYCSIDSGLYISDYIHIYYTNYYSDGSKGEDMASYYEAIIYKCNEFMSVYKICQICKAYDLNVEDDDSGISSSNYKENGRRMRTLRGLLSENNHQGG